MTIRRRMETNKKTNTTPAELSKATDDTGSTSAIEGTAILPVAKPDDQITADPAPDNFTKHIERQTLRAFLDAVNVWRLNYADSARLVGVEPASVQVWKTGKAPTSEEVLARMTMVALIRTALDITFSSSLSEEWMTLPNSGYPYLGLSPVAYVSEHGWPGLFWVLRQVQGHAVGK